MKIEIKPSAPLRKQIEAYIDRQSVRIGAFERWSKEITELEQEKATLETEIPALEAKADHRDETALDAIERKARKLRIVNNKLASLKGIQHPLAAQYTGFCDPDYVRLVESLTPEFEEGEQLIKKALQCVVGEVEEKITPTLLPFFEDAVAAKQAASQFPIVLRIKYLITNCNGNITQAPAARFRSIIATLQKILAGNAPWNFTPATAASVPSETE